jgi:hypothetical protein
LICAAWIYSLFSSTVPRIVGGLPTWRRGTIGKRGTIEERGTVGGLQTRRRETIEERGTFVEKRGYLHLKCVLHMGIII